MIKNIERFVEAISSSLEQLGAALISKRSKGDFDQKWEGTQLKSNADLFADQWIGELLGKLTPEIPVLSEEGDIKSNTRPGQYWLIDPIDGTASYAHGFDGFVTQVALIQNDQPVLGVVHAPALSQTYVGLLGQGAFMNGIALESRTLNEIEPVRIIDNYPDARGVAKQLMDNIPNSLYVECGSLSLKAIQVALNNADIFVKDVLVRDWDFAAPIVILKELGVSISQYDGSSFCLDGQWEKRGVIVCANSELHAFVLGMDLSTKQ